MSPPQPWKTGTITILTASRNKSAQRVKGSFRIAGSRICSKSSVPGACADGSLKEDLPHNHEDLGYGFQLSCKKLGMMVNWNHSTLEAETSFLQLTGQLVLLNVWALDLNQESHLTETIVVVVVLNTSSTRGSLYTVSLRKCTLMVIHTYRRTLGHLEHGIQTIKDSSYENRLVYMMSGN